MYKSGIWGVNKLAVGDCDSYLISQNGEKVQIGYIVQSGSKPIAATIESLHDANLIAAAPDMLAALEAIDARISGDWSNEALIGFGPCSTNQQLDIQDIARTAIIKAKGQQT